VLLVVDLDVARLHHRHGRSSLCPSKSFQHLAAVSRALLDARPCNKEQP
jgi:hypothetical protein